MASCGRKYRACLCEEGDLLLIKPCATIGQEVTLVLGGLKGLVKDFRPLEGMYCVEVLAKKSGNQSVGSTVVYCKREAFQYDEEDDDLEDQDPEGADVNPEPKRTAYDAYIEEFFKNMKTGNDKKDPFKDLKTVKSTTSNMKNKKRKILGGATSSGSKRSRFEQSQQVEMGYDYRKHSFKTKGHRSFLQDTSGKGGPVLGLEGANVLLLGANHIDESFTAALVESEKVNLVELGETDRIDLVIHSKISTLVNQDRYVMFALLEKFEAQNQELRMIKSSFLLKCYNGRYYVDWSIVNFTDIEKIKAKFQTWWSRVTDSNDINFMRYIEPVKGYSCYNVKRGGKKEEEDDIVIRSGKRDRNFIDLEVPRMRMKTILTESGDMILRILDLKRDLKQINRKKMPTGWRIVKQRRLYGISKGHEETTYVGPNGKNQTVQMEC